MSREHFHNKNGLLRTGTVRHREDGSRWHGQQEDRDHAGPAAVDDEAVVAGAPLGGRDGVAQRWATVWCGSWFVTTTRQRPPCSPDLSPLDFFLERAQDTARSVSTCCQPLQNCEHFCTASLTERGQAVVGCSSQRRLFLNSDHETSPRAAQRHTSKTRH